MVGVITSLAAVNEAKEIPSLADVIEVFYS